MDNEKVKRAWILDPDLKSHSATHLPDVAVRIRGLCMVGGVFERGWGRTKNVNPRVVSCYSNLGFLRLKKRDRRTVVGYSCGALLVSLRTVISKCLSVLVLNTS